MKLSPVALSSEKAESLADRVRNTYWNDDAFPVDPVTIGRELGIKIVDADLPEDIAGAFLKKIGEDPIIMLHTHDPVSRKRFTCAHEIGHYLYRFERGHFDDQDIDHIDKRSDLSSNGSDPEEVSANRIAAALLMPKQKVKELYKKSFDLYAMANFFKVSPTAMSVRLGILDLK